MRPSYTHKHITLEGCCLRHRWCGLGFCHDDCVNLFQGISHPNIRQYKMSMVGWLCLDHTSGVVGWNRFFYPIYFPSFYFFGPLIRNRLLSVSSLHCKGIRCTTSNSRLKLAPFQRKTCFISTCLTQ